MKADRERPAKLLGMLGSEHAGERDNAALAIERHRISSNKGQTKMYDAKFVWLAFGAGVVIGIGLGKGGDGMIQAFAVVGAVGVALSLAVSAIDRVIEWRHWRRITHGAR
jgi:hypothetical protein